MLVQAKYTMFPGIDASKKVRITLQEQILQGLDLEHRNDISVEGKVHEFRKAVKRSRAILRILKFAVVPETYHKLDGFLGQAARILTRQRESTVNLKTFMLFSNKFSDVLSEVTVNKIRTSLSKNVRSAYELQAGNELKNNLSISFNLLRICRIELNEIDLQPFSLKQLHHHMQKTYEKARRLFNDATYTLDAEVIHKWRKFVKHLLFQVKFAPHEVSIPDEDKNRFEKITDMIGEDHDLYVMEKAILSKVELENSEAELLKKLVFEERKKIQQKAFSLGSKVFLPQKLTMHSRSYSKVS